MEINYPIKHWITALVLGSLLLVTYDAISHSDLITQGRRTAFFAFTLWGLIFSLPMFLLNLWVYNLMDTRDVSPLIIKIVLNLIAITGAIGLVTAVGGSIAPALTLSYIVSILISSLLYKVYPIRVKTSTDFEE